MKWVNLLQRWTMRGIHAAVLGAALLGSASAAFAQTPAATTSQANKHYTKSQTFKLPVKMSQEDRLTLKEIRLYVKTPTGQWSMQESGSPFHDEFSCKVSQDGEYWYMLATVDRAGRMTPADLNAEPPSQKVIVDTVAPQIQVQATPDLNGELSLRCTVVDANPDWSTLRAVCHTDVGDIPLEMVANEPGVFRLKGAELLRHPVIVTVKDHAKNEGMERVNLRDLIGTTMVPATTPGKGSTELSQLPLPAKGSTESSHPADRSMSPVVLPEPVPSKGGTPSGPAVVRAEFPPTTPPENLPQRQPEQTAKASINLPEAPGKTLSASRQLINTTQASIEYRIDQVGPSGVGKVEIFMTPDNGQSWHRLAEDTVKRSPAEIRLPGDGVYGIRIVVTNGNGFGGKAPVRGDAPHCTVEVDTTPPFVQLRSAEVQPGAGTIEIRWNATDKNLGTDPVTLHYRSRPDGPWQVIARNVKNDGVYRWAFPRDVGSQFFFKIEVADQSGNIAHAVSSQATTVDMTEPRATIVGVSGGAMPR
jgi:hypothetical protein